MNKGVIRMSYRFNVKSTNYECINVSNLNLEELIQITEKQIELNLMFENILIKAKEAFEFARNLFKYVSNEDETDFYEEVENKLNNCHLFMENMFSERAKAMHSCMQFTEANHGNYKEIFEAYIEIVTRGFEETLNNKLNQIARIATTVYGILDDLQFTLELNGLINLEVNKANLPELLEVNHFSEDKIGEDLPELTLELICA
ncbi:hypothetical protein [Lysinibacillus sp. NPDC096212]|uniref:hypothetical protein n=1 Tax=Lysinibacillus sp. NPDC096212 TaxID=3364135 RepID=UPI003810A118